LKTVTVSSSRVTSPYCLIVLSIVRRHVRCAAPFIDSVHSPCSASYEQACNPRLHRLRSPYRPQEGLNFDDNIIRIFFLPSFLVQDRCTKLRNEEIKRGLFSDVGSLNRVTIQSTMQPRIPSFLSLIVMLTWHIYLTANSGHASARC